MVRSSKKVTVVRAGRTGKTTKFSRKSRDSVKGPPENATVYKGPVVIDKKDGGMHMDNFSSDFPASWTGSGGSVGSFSTVFAASGVTNASNWSTVSGDWVETRVCAISYQYVPYEQNGQLHEFSSSTVASLNTVAVYSTPLFVADYHGDATAFASVNAANNHVGRKVGCFNQPMRGTTRMKQVDEADFTNVTSPTFGGFGFKTYISGTAESGTTVQLGMFLVTYTVQFRQRALSNTALTKPVLCLSSRYDREKEEKEYFVLLKK